MIVSKNWPYVLLLCGGLLLLSGAEIGPGPFPVDPVNPVVPVDPHVDPDAENVTNGVKCVLIVYDEDKRASYPKEQQEILTSAPLRVWLRNRVSIDQTGTSEFRVFASTTQMNDYVPQSWQNAMKQVESDKKPVIAWSDGKKFYKSELPGSVTEVQRLLEGYLK